jgi:hypothetical protein
LGAPSEPFNIRIKLRNASDKPVRLTFRNRHHFEVSIYRLNLIFPSEYVWPPPLAHLPAVGTVMINSQETHEEIVPWPQVDIHNRPVDKGTYFVQVRCVALEFPAQDREVFVIK